MAAQLPDKILFEGEWRDLYSNPLEDYWVKRGKKHPAFLPASNCRRGYIASWEIQNNHLYLKAIDGNIEKKFLFFAKRTASYTLKSLFPRSMNKLVKAIWFSGKLRIPLGKMTMYEHHAYDSRFEKEQIITIDRGEILKSVTLDFMQKKLVVTADLTDRSATRL
jgi:hypothetical protein